MDTLVAVAAIAALAAIASFVWAGYRLWRAVMRGEQQTSRMNQV